MKARIPGMRLRYRLVGVAVVLAAGGGLLATGAASAASAATAATSAASAPAAAAVVGPNPVDVNGLPACPGGRLEHTFGGSSSLTMDAIGFGNPTDVQINTVNGGTNQFWCAKPLSDGYDAIVSVYSTNNTGPVHHMCLNVDGNSYVSGTHIRSHQCDTVVTVNEQFKLIPSQGAFLIEPAFSYHNQQNLCLNSAGGVVQHARVILFACDSLAANEHWRNPAF
jgi:hypothetical protein